jgi:hypothetical protein
MRTNIQALSRIQTKGLQSIFEQNFTLLAPMLKYLTLSEWKLKKIFMKTPYYSCFIFYKWNSITKRAYFWKTYYNIPFQGPILSDTTTRCPHITSLCVYHAVIDCRKSEHLSLRWPTMGECSYQILKIWLESWEKGVKYTQTMLWFHKPTISLKKSILNSTITNNCKLICINLLYQEI